MRAVVARQRAVGERVVGLLGHPRALEEQQQRLVPGGLAGAQHGLDARADVRPDLRPHLARGAPERPRVLLAERVAPVGVVAEERQLRAPRHPHREAAGEEHPDDAREAARPRSPAARSASCPSRPPAGRARPDRPRSGRRARFRCSRPRSLRDQPASRSLGSPTMSSTFTSPDNSRMRSTAEAPAVTTANALVVLARALLLADDHAEPARVDERHLAQVEHHGRRLGLRVEQRLAQLGRGREVDLPGGDHDHTASTRLVANVEQRVERHHARAYPAYGDQVPSRSTPGENRAFARWREPARGVASRP